MKRVFEDEDGMEVAVETSLYNAVVKLLTTIFGLSWIFSLFAMQTKGFNFTNALTYSEPAQGHFGHHKACMRQRVACATCAVGAWIDDCFPCFLFQYIYIHLCSKFIFQGTSETNASFVHIIRLIDKIL
mgnify:CR=1 FL=1